MLRMFCFSDNGYNNSAYGNHVSCVTALLETIKNYNKFEDLAITIFCSVILSNLVKAAE